MLDTMMKMQNELQNSLNYNLKELAPKDRAEYMRDQYVYLGNELQEALYEMPYFKSWKNYSSMTTEEQRVAWGKVKMELVDATHFFLNMLLASGMTAEELYGMYVAKNIENHRRQDAGYTHDVSYKDQPVDEVMKGVGEACTVYHDGEMIKSHDYIALLHQDNGMASIYYNTDTLSMGIAALMVKARYESMLKEESEQAQHLITESITRLLEAAQHE